MSQVMAAANFCRATSPCDLRPHLGAHPPPGPKCAPLISLGFVRNRQCSQLAERILSPPRLPFRHSGLTLTL